MIGKKELTDLLSQKMGVTKALSHAAITDLIEVIKEQLLAGEEVMLVDFVSFKIKECAEREGRNVKTGEEITIPAHEKVVVKASKNLRDIRR